VAPMARRTSRARRAIMLFAAATLWVVGNLARLLLVTAFGPPAEGLYGVGFLVLTLIALSGWILFPALLLYAVICDLPALRERIGAWQVSIFLPPAVLGTIVYGTALRGALGPVTLDQAIAPILFYVCCYVAAASGLTLWPPRLRDDAAAAGETDVPAATAWGRAGSAVIFLVALVGALSVEGIVPLPGAVSDATVGALIVLIQLFSLAPIGLVTLAILRHGKADTVLSGALIYLVGIVTVFFLVFAGLLTVERLVGPQAGWTHALVASLYVLSVLILGERFFKLLRDKAGGWFRTERQRARERLRQFGEQMRLILDARRLAEATVATVGEALRARSAVLFLRDPASLPGAPPKWLRASYRPDPPFFTEVELSRVWRQLQHAGTTWARNAELDESDLSAADSELLKDYGAVLAVPIAGGESDPAGLLVLGRKERRRSVYNLEDVALLRVLAGQLALATERLTLIEREKALIRQTAEAQLTALRAQINPHFLFNTLNTIAALIDERPEDAERAVERLARIFRYILQMEDRTFVSLSEELVLVRDYLAIEQARFGDDLIVEEHFEQPVREVSIPAFTLQTLVENAIKHGIERKRDHGTVRLSGWLDPDSDMAILTVYDSGVGIPDLFGTSGDGALPVGAKPEFFGIGLQNVADRLERLYGRSDLLQFRSDAEFGTTVELRIPLQPAARDVWAS
jgi:two-component system, LytTR family, sensor kinase